MAILDIFNAGQDEDENLLKNNPQALSVLSGLVNNESTQQGPQVQQGQSVEAPAQAPQQAYPQQTAQQVPQQGQQEGNQSSGGFWDTVKSVADKVGSGLANASQNPGLLDSLRAFGASVGNDKQGYESAMNSYTQRLDQNAQQRAKQQQEAVRAQREQEAKDQQAYIDNLYKVYTPESVQAYRGTGNRALLVENQSVVNARNKDTREEQQQQLQTTKVNHDMEHADSQLAQAQERLKMDNKRYGAVTVDGAEYDAPGQYTTPTGQDITIESNGGVLSAKPTPVKERTPTGESTSMSQIRTDLGTVNNAFTKTEDGRLIAKKGSGVSDITGPITGRSETLRDWSSSGGKQSTRDLYNAAMRTDAAFQNMGIAEAKAAGASGINTMAEVQQFSKGMPQYDYTSEDAFAASQQAKMDYIDRWNASHPDKKNRGSTGPSYGTGQEQAAPQPQQASPHQSGGWTVVRHQ